MNTESLPCMATITREVGNRRFPDVLGEGDSGTCVRESCHQEAHSSFVDIPTWSKGDP